MSLEVAGGKTLSIRVCEKAEREDGVVCDLGSFGERAPSAAKAGC